MKKFFTITLLLLAIASNVIAQDRLNLLYNQCADETLRQYGEYLLDPKSLDDETAIQLGCTILDKVEGLYIEKKNGDILQYGYRNGFSIGMIIAILKTMPADIKLRQAYNFKNRGIVFFDNGKVFVRGTFLHSCAKDLYENISARSKVEYRVMGILYDPFGESGYGYPIKAKDINKDYFPRAFVSKGLTCENLKDDIGGDYVIGMGRTFNLQNINGTDLFFDLLDNNNEILFAHDPFQERLKLQRDPEYPVYMDVPMRSIHWSSSDEQAFIEACNNVDKAHDAQILAKEEAQWAPLKKKYGAAAFNRVYNNGEVWIGEPVELVRINHRLIKKTQSFGGTVEIYRGIYRTVWVSNGKVTKIVSK